MRYSIDISENTIDLGPEMFASDDLKVICYKGQNYYRTCDQTVWLKNEAEPMSTCIKPVGHLSYEHEDVYGRTKEGERVVTLDVKIRSSAFQTLRRTGLDDTNIFNALNALQCSGHTIIREQ